MNDIIFEVAKIVSKYENICDDLISEMKNIPASVCWGVKSGKEEAYKNMCNDLRKLISKYD